MVAVYAVGRLSGAHLNPAVTLALASIGAFPWSDVPGYIAAQMIGALAGAVLVWLMYLPHWAVTQNADLKLAVFCTGPAIRKLSANLLTETIATAAFVFAVLGIGAYRTAFGKPRAVIGLQAETFGTTKVWLLPSPSGLNANHQLPDLVAEFSRLRAEAFGAPPAKA
jgi:glycerol uptake facilitator protein